MQTSVETLFLPCFCLRRISQ